MTDVKNALQFIGIPQPKIVRKPMPKPQKAARNLFKKPS